MGSSLKAIVSDSHYHNWSRFATTNSDGVNSRLQIQLDETLRVAKDIKKRGGDTIIHGGDMFHVRGHLTPSVLNPVIQTYKQIIDMGVKVIVLAGNHDLESKESQELTNASSALAAIGVQVVSSISMDETNKRLFIPWTPSIDSLKDVLENAVSNKSEYEVYLHAPVNGVIMGIPDHGLDATYLKSLGYKCVFSGHYHNHVAFDGGVCSIGALTHQTFGDVNSKAGYLIHNADDNSVEHVESSAPKFVNVDGDMSEEQICELAKGNYVKAKIGEATETEVNEIRQALEEAGALGVVVQSVPRIKGAARGTASVSAGASISTSVSEWIQAKKFDNEKAVMSAADEILKEVGL